MGRNSLFPWATQYHQRWTVKVCKIAQNLFFYRKRRPAELQNNQQRLFELYKVPAKFGQNLESIESDFFGFSKEI